MKSHRSHDEVKAEKFLIARLKQLGNLKRCLARHRVLNSIEFKSYFRRYDFYTAGITTFLVLIFYYLTLAPTVTLGQSGAFAVAGQYLGIGRVPGYPVWHLLAKVFISLFGFVQYRGYPNPAWATNFMSAVFGALSCGMLAMLVCRIGRSFWKGRWGSMIIGIFIGIIYAISPVMWSQSVITETHTLTLFFILLFLVVSLIHLDVQTAFSSLSLACVFALGLAQAYIVVLLFPSFLLCLLFSNWRLCREFFLACVLILLLPMSFFNIGPVNLNGLYSLLIYPWGHIVLGLSIFAGFILPLFLSRWGKVAVGMVALIILGLSMYSYVYFASEGGAPMQFGYGRTWSGFWHVLARRQYAAIQLHNIWCLHYLEIIKTYFNLLGHQFRFYLWLLILAPFIFARYFRGVYLKWLGICVLAFFMYSLVVLAYTYLRLDFHDWLIKRVLFIPSFAISSIFIGIGLQFLGATSYTLLLKCFSKLKACF